jgi:hypothetical protein
MQLSKVQEIRRRNKAARLRAQKALDAPTSSLQEGHTVDPNASGLDQLRQMQAAHAEQKKIEKEIRRMAYGLETGAEVGTFWRALVAIPEIDLMAMAGCVPFQLRHFLPADIQTALDERIAARVRRY